MHVNLACGATYVDGWLNLDYMPVSPAIKKANLLARLPLDDGSASIVYSSHFLEHIPQDLVLPFLKECFRITQSRGKIRLVLPDFNEMCLEYLEMRKSEEHDKANFLMLEILDQCVRQKSGGQLAEFYMHLRQTNNQKMSNYVMLRVGEDLASYSCNTQTLMEKISTHILQPSRLKNKFLQFYCKLITSLLPTAFLKQNVSYTLPGEKHCWLYDFYSLSKLLEQVGFGEIKKMTFNTSSIQDFPLFPLDVTQEGMPRKGSESMYIEAIKL